MDAESIDQRLRDDDEWQQKAAITLGLLNAVHDNSSVTQRRLARELNVALGIANATFKRCIAKGLIKVRQAPARRYAYYLTPRGFAEKSRLTAEYLSVSLKFFRVARDQLETLFRDCAVRGWGRVVLAGAGDLAEIARLCAPQPAIELIAVIDSDRGDGFFAGLPVLPNLQALAPTAFDAVLITDVRTPQSTFDAVLVAANRMGLAPERVLAAKLLRISTTVARPESDGATE